MESGSKPGKLNATDLRKIGIGAGIAVSGAFLAYLVDVAIPEMESSGAISVALAALFATCINALRKFITDNSGQ